MKVNNFKRISVEDFDQEMQPTIEKLSFAINPFLEQITQAFNGNIDFENLNQEIVEFSVQVNTSGVPTPSVELRSNLRSRVKGYSVIRVQVESSGGTSPSSLPLISFSQAEALVRILSITGLTAGTRYRITAIAIG